MLHSPQILLTPRKAAVVAAGSVWDPLAKGTEMTLSTTTITNDTVSNTVGGGTWSTVKGATGHSTGLNYLELIFTAGSTNNLDIGFADATTGGGAGLNNFSGGFLKSVGNLEANGSGQLQGAGFSAASFAGGWGPLVTNDVMQLALDCTNGFGYLGKNGLWLNSGVPTSGATGTGAAFTFTGSPTLFPTVSLQITTDGSMKIRTASGFSFSLPAGYSAWG